MGERFLELRGLIAQPQHLIPHRINQDVFGPLPEAAYTLGKPGYGPSMVDIPDLVGNSAKQLLITLAPIPYAQERMQETQNQGDARK
jgi:hypothetical protein